MSGLANSLRRLLSGSSSQHPSPTQRTISAVFYPAFDNIQSAADHLNRAKWYLQGQSGLLFRVTYYLPEGNPGSQDVPSHSPEYQPVFSQQRAVTSEHELIESLQTADLVLVWRGTRVSDARIRESGTGAMIVNVDPYDVESIEYGTQAKILWRIMYSQDEKKEILQASKNRLIQSISAIPSNEREFVLAMGTGPSFQRYPQLSREGGTVIACNSAVHDTHFLKTFRPDFLVFGDAAHHLGPSHHAAYFREDLKRALEILPDLVVVTNAQYYGLLQEQFSTFLDRIVWLEQSSKDVVTDLIRNFSAPMLDSVMNIFMLPLASTISPRIFIIGADGHSQKQELNDDFWGHAEAFNYFSRIKSAHEAHPTFDLHRKHGVNGRVPTQLRHSDSVEQSLAKGERHSNRYWPLMSSSIQAFAERVIPLGTQEAFRKHDLISLRDLARNLG